MIRFLRKPNKRRLYRSNEWAALLGRRDEPTDGVQDYCELLCQALAERGFSLALVRVPWADRSWLSTILWLWNESKEWKGRRVLVQYTALGWSRRGFPLGLLLLVFLLRSRNARLAVVFHDPSAYGGHRLVDRARRIIQHFVMVNICSCSDRAILPVSSTDLSWLGSQIQKTAFIPVGSNIPPPDPPEVRQAEGLLDVKTIAIFGITPGEAGQRQMRDIQTIAQAAAKCGLQIHVIAFGRGTREVESDLRRLLTSSNIRLSVLGLLPAADIGHILATSNVQIDVRAPLSSRRGSAIAGIICGTPVAGFDSSETDKTMRDAGVVLVPVGDITALSREVTRILRDNVFQEELRQKNRIASEKYFSWTAISSQFLTVLNEGDFSSPASGKAPSTRRDKSDFS